MDTVKVPVLGSLPDLSKISDKERDAEVAQAQLAIAVGQAIRLLGQVVPTWPRRERRALANAFRQGGKGYTKK